MKPRILLSVNKGKAWYEQAVEACGGVPTATYLPEIDLSYDGLILGGGNDVHPRYYGQEIDGAEDFDEARDEREMDLAKAYIQAGKPILGICRGGQLLNVAFGGTLIQHLACTNEHKVEGEEWHSHGVVAKPNSVFEKMYGKEFRVNSLHHQAVGEMGKGLKATLLAEGNEVVEGFEHESLPIFGVQWHPEKMCLAAKRADTADGIEVFRYFVALCQK
jgi:putative glutamine amidotransferase